MTKLKLGQKEAPAVFMTQNLLLKIKKFFKKKAGRGLGVLTTPGCVAVVAALLLG